MLFDLATKRLRWQQNTLICFPVLREETARPGNCNGTKREEAQHVFNME
jgi:hypothetical protein